MGEGVPGFLMHRHDDGLCHAYVREGIGRLEHFAPYDNDRVNDCGSLQSSVIVTFAETNGAAGRI